LDTVTSLDVDNQSLWWHIQLASEIAQVLQERKYRLIFLTSESLDGERLAQMARTRAADGFILPQIHLTDPRVQALRDASAPFVTIGRPRGHKEIPWVDADTSGGAEMAAYHLLDLGHRDILYIGWSGVGARYGHSYQVHRGIRAAFRRRDVPWPDALTHYVRHDTSAAGHYAMADALDREISFTAVITSSDALGVGVLYTLWERGYRVPDEMSVFSCSDSAATALAYPALSTLQLPRTEMGQAAVKALLEQIEGSTLPVSHTLLPTSLTIRQSTGPAPPGRRRARP
ncbi:MAG: substrate-binding domain-containing protein, partial [Chloroflexi bacterium]|nr:substrate-binding domain-containing protein [Chloroflexota bacterium]